MTSLLFSGNCIYVSVALINYNLAVQNYKRQFILIFASFPAAVNSCIFFFLQGKGNLVLDFSLLGLAVEFWYFVFKIVLTYCEKKKSSSDREGSVQFLKQNVFLTCSWRLLRSNALEQLEFKLEKMIGI